MTRSILRYRPLGRNLLVIRRPREERVGSIVSHTEDLRVIEAEVLELGPAVFLHHASKIREALGDAALSVADFADVGKAGIPAVGDVVIVRKSAGALVDRNGPDGEPKQDVLLVDIADILAVVREKE